MSLLDDFDEIVANQRQDEAYQQKLEMLKYIEKYPGDMEGISQWFVRRWIAYSGDLKSIPFPGAPNKIYYGIVPVDLFGTFGNMCFNHDKRYFIAVLDGETNQTSFMALTPKEYCEFINLKSDYESTR